MVDLPAPATSPAPAAVARRPANPSLRAAPARDGVARADDNPFQAVLAQEMELAADGQARPGPGGHSAAADASLKAGDDAAQAGVAGDAASSPAFFSLTALPLAPVGDSGTPASTGDAGLKAGGEAAQAGAAGDALPSPAFFGATPLALALDAGGNTPAFTGAMPSALALDGDRTTPALFRAEPLPQALGGGRNTPAFSGVAPLPHAPGGDRNAPAGTGGAALALDARQDWLAKAVAAANAEPQPGAAPAAAILATPGKFLPAAATELRREIAFDASLPETQQAGPAPSALSQAGTATQAERAHAPAALADTPVGQRGWDRALGDKLVWMAGQSQQVAQLHLNPPELGPLEITLTLNHDQASAQFVSAHALVRDAIEAAMPRLREMLADNGITLGDTSVSADASREHAQLQQQHEPRAYADRPGVAPADPGVVARGTQPLHLSRGLVDTFA